MCAKIEENKGGVFMSKEKSVLYPSATWTECEDLIGKIDKYSGKVGYDIIAQDYGLKNASAKSFKYRISTAKQFGLINTAGGTVELTDLARQYLYPINGYVQAEIRIKCFQIPPLYSKLIERFNGRALPNVTQLGNILFQDYKIVKTVIGTAAQCFLDNAELMGVSSNGVLNYNSQPITKEEQKEVSPDFIASKEDDKHQTPPNTVVEPVLKTKPAEKDYIQQNYETESGKLAQIIIPKDATQDDLAAINDMLSILIKRRFKTDIQ